MLRCEEYENQESEITRLKREISRLRKKVKKRTKKIKSLKTSNQMSIDNKEIIKQTTTNLEDCFGTFCFSFQNQINSLNLLAANIKS